MIEWLKEVAVDPNFWVLLSTVCCFAYIGRKAYRPMLANLDARSQAISDRLVEAENLRLEAERILAEYKQKADDALHEAENVLRNAERRASQLQAQMEHDFAESVQRQEGNARSRISRMQDEAIREIKDVLIAASLSDVKAHANNNATIKPSLEHSLAGVAELLQK